MWQLICHKVYSVFVSSGDKTPDLRTVKHGHYVYKKKDIVKLRKDIASNSIVPLFVRAPDKLRMVTL